MFLFEFMFLDSFLERLNLSSSRLIAFMEDSELCNSGSGQDGWKNELFYFVLHFPSPPMPTPKMTGSSLSNGSVSA